MPFSGALNTFFGRINATKTTIQMIQLAQSE